MLAIHDKAICTIENVKSYIYHQKKRPRRSRLLLIML